LSVDRREEIRALLRLSADDVMRRAGGRLIVLPDLAALHRHFARAVADELRAARNRGEPARLILPVGPTGQYPILADLIHRERISLADAWLFFMDEYCDESGRAVPAGHPLSFKGEAHRLLLDRLDPALAPRPERVVFPDETNVDRLAELIAAAGGIDTCYGGIGIHGHLAFNEPEPGVRDSQPRRVRLNDFTVTINAVRSHVGGNLETFPREAFTLGMAQILGARRIRLYCRNGCEFDWANTVLRLALFGEPGDDYPVTHIRGCDYIVAADAETLGPPEHVI